MNHILDRIELLLSAAEIGEKRDCSTPLSTPQHPPMPSMYILYIHCKDLHMIYIIHTFIYINIRGVESPAAWQPGCQPLGQSGCEKPKKLL